VVAKAIESFRTMKAQEARVAAWMIEKGGKLWQEKGDSLRAILIQLAEEWRAVCLFAAWKCQEVEGPFTDKKHQKYTIWAALHIYAPLAQKAGLKEIQYKFEDKAFQYLHPEEWRKVTNMLKDRAIEDEQVLDQACRQVKQELLQDERFMTALGSLKVKARVKQPYSVWRKMVATNSTEGLDNIMDLLALRIICDPAVAEDASPDQVKEAGHQLCFKALEALQRAIPRFVGRDKNYIDSPKKNGYQSLHTTLAQRRDKRWVPVEVQIRTMEMHQVAEWGVASHAAYKGENSMELLCRDWLIREKKTHPGVTGNGDFMTWLQVVLKQHQQIMFLGPDGRIWHVDRGCTLMDVINQYINTEKEISKREKKLKKSLRRCKINGVAVASAMDRILHTGDVITV